MTRALGRETLALVLLLAAWEIALAWTGSGRMLRAFAADEPTADLEALAGDRLRPGDGALHLPGAAEPPSVSRLAGLEVRPGRRYLLTIRAEPGMRFSLQLIDRDDQRPAARLRLPPRGETEEVLIALDPESLPASNRLEIWNESASDLVIRELAFRELGAGHRWTRRATALIGPAILALFALRHRRSLVEHLRSGSSRSAADRRAWDAAIALAFLLACFHAFRAAPVQQVHDSKFSSVVSHRLVTAGTLTLPASFTPGEDGALPYQLQQIDGRVYHFYPNAVAVLNAPFAAVFDRLGVAPVAPNGLFLRHHENRILGAAAAVQAAALCALLYLLARLYLRPAPALGMAALFAFGTQIFSSVSRPYWSHAWALLLLAGAVYLLLSPALRGRAAAHAASATLLSWSFFCRPPMSLSILGLLGYLVAVRRRRLGWLAVPGLGWAALFAVFSLRTFGSPIPPYFLSSHLESGVLRVGSDLPAALLGNLLSPSRGLLVTVPFTVLVAILAVRHRRSLPEKALAWTAVLVCLAHWLLISANRAWWKGAFGARLFSDVLVWLFLLTLFVAIAWSRERAGASAVGRAATVAAAALLVAASLFVNFRGAAARETSLWHGYSVWDWRHPQFMAGLLPGSAERPLDERIADARTVRHAAARQRLAADILEDESTPKRPVGGAELVAVGVTWDRWTHGDRPAALVATNPGPEPWVPALRLAVWAEGEVYPLVVSIEDGEDLVQHRFERRGTRTLELAPVAPRSRRLYVVWSDRAWSPGGPDSRTLGVQLLPPAGQENPRAVEGNGAGGGEGVDEKSKR